MGEEDPNTKKNSLRTKINKETSGAGSSDVSCRKNQTTNQVCLEWQVPQSGTVRRETWSTEKKNQTKKILRVGLGGVRAPVEREEKNEIEKNPIGGKVTNPESTRRRTRKRVPTPRALGSRSACMCRLKRGRCIPSKSEIPRHGTDSAKCRVIES